MTEPREQCREQTEIPARKKRVTFVFDERSIECVEKLKLQGRCQQYPQLESRPVIRTPQVAELLRDQPGDVVSESAELPISPWRAVD